MSVENIPAQFFALAADAVVEGLNQLGVQVLNSLGAGARSILLTICNDTNETLVLDHTYRDSGEDFANLPQEIPPHKTGTFHVRKKLGAIGVKGTAVYRVKNSNEKIVFYFCNPFTGKNEIGVNSYQDKNWSRHEYYCNVPSQSAEHMHDKTVGRLTFHYQMTGGNSSAGSWVIRTTG